jgi:amino-acid N-acetyltransferase
MIAFVRCCAKRDGNVSPEPETRRSLLVRGATPADVTAILELARRGQLLDAGIAECIDGFVVAERAGCIIGTAGLERHGADGLLRTVAVAVESRDDGVGRVLVEAAMRRAGELELDSVYLLTTTARDFFGRLGFEAIPRGAAPLPIRESWEFAAGCPSSAVLMRRTI